MRIDETNKEQVNAWFNAARNYLKKHLRGLSPNQKAPIWDGVEIRSMNDVYTIVFGIKESTGKNTGKAGKANAKPEHLAKLRTLIPDLDERIENMDDKPPELQLIQANEKIKNLEEANQKLKDQVAKLIEAMNPSQPINQKEMQQQLERSNKRIETLYDQVEFLKKTIKEKNNT